MKKIGYTIFLLLFTTMCSSGNVNINTKLYQDPNDKILGKASGEACGHKIISLPGAMALDFIPINFNSRLERSMQNAVSSVSGAKSLINIEIEEKWYYWLFGQTRCVIVRGDAI